ncbi:anthrone oxygenase family protein [Micromonospora purpureochromogenes]|uniref:anthrone oxygenase family protein n=1 Tax=Micromonospora purpureochromogenes TaxID=47872 RepID=UPI0033348B4D
MTDHPRLVPVVRTVALLFTGLLAGAFGYGALNVAQTFKAVPLEVRLTFHTALMKMNGPVMQTTMGLALLSSLALAVLLRGAARRLAAVASALVATSFLVTRFGNVPINGRIKVWAVGGAPPDHAAILRRWELFNDVRTVAALVAFLLLLALVTPLVRPSR